MAKTRSDSSSREIAKLRKEIDALTQTLAAVKKSNGSAYMLRVNTDDPDKGEYRVLRQFYHLRKDAVNDMNYHFVKICGKDAVPDVATESRKEFKNDEGFAFVATIDKITII